MARSGGDALKIQESRVFPTHAESVFDTNWPAQRGDRFCGGDVSWISRIPPCPVFSPSLEEFSDPLAYISSIAPLASKYGICKIIPPILPSVPAGRVLTKEKPAFKFNTRVQPMRLSDWDCDDNKVTFLTSAQRYTFQEFEKMANKFHSRRFSSAAPQPPSLVEAEFWKEILAGNSDNIQYASDVDGSAFSTSSDDPLANSKWNLKVVSSLPRSILRLLDTIIPGVTEPMLYIGMLFSMFAWHVEDHYLYSINYHHCGASKTWYGVPGHAAQGLETVVKEEIYDPKLLSQHGQGAAYDLLIGKTTMFPPNILLQHGVPVYRAVQAPGEFVITFPRSYHAGFSHGFNCGEAVNFAMADWFPYGAAACRRYSLLNRMPLLPHEELLWKEAQICESVESTKADSALQVPIRRSFLRLMSFQHKVRWLLKSRGASVYTSSSAPVNVPCMLCKHMCYIAFLTCRCFPEPTCLNHAAEMRRCNCGNDRRVILHRDIKKMDELARNFRCCSGDGQGLPVVEDGMNYNMGILEEEMLNADDYSLYVPFEHIDAPDMVQNERAGLTNAPCAEDARKCENESAVNKVKPGVAIRTMPSKRPLVLKAHLLKDSINRDHRLSSCFKKDPPPNLEATAPGNEVGGKSKRQAVKLVRTSSGDSVLLLKDVAAELNILGPLEGITKRWQAEARTLGLNLKYSSIKDRDGTQLALSYKAIQRLKRVLSTAQADELERLFTCSRRDSDDEARLSSRGSCQGYISGKRKLSTTGDCDDSLRKRRYQGSESSCSMGSRHRDRSLSAEHSSCVSSTSEALGRPSNQNFVASAGKKEKQQRSIEMQQYDCSSMEQPMVQQHKRVLVKNGVRVSPTENREGHCLASDGKATGERRAPFPKLKVKGPSLSPSINKVEGSSDNTGPANSQYDDNTHKTSKTYSFQEGLTRSVESSYSYSRLVGIRGGTR